VRCSPAKLLYAQAPTLVHLSRLCERGSLFAPRFHHFLLSFANHLRYTCTLTASAITKLSSASLMSTWRGGDDF
jgi:hypothetical protein